MWGSHKEHKEDEKTGKEHKGVLTVYVVPGVIKDYTEAIVKVYDDQNDIPKFESIKSFELRVRNANEPTSLIIKRSLGSDPALTVRDQGVFSITTLGNGGQYSLIATYEGEKHCICFLSQCDIILVDSVVCNGVAFADEVIKFGCQTYGPWTDMDKV